MGRLPSSGAISAMPAKLQFRAGELAQVRRQPDLVQPSPLPPGLPIGQVSLPIAHLALTFEDEKHFLVGLMVTASAFGEIIVHFKELDGRLGQAELLGDGCNLLL